MMKVATSDIEAQYFALLRTALWGTPVAIERPVDWQGVMQLARHHANNVLIDGVALRLPEAQRPTAEICKQMQAEMRANLVKYLNLKQILQTAVQALRQHDIEPKLLKGFGLALLYPNPNLRQFGDIDLFVGLKDFHPACEVLRTLPGCYNWGQEVDSGHHYNIEFGRYPMEVHRVSADVDGSEDAAIFSAIECEGMTHSQRVDFEGFEISIPSKEFMVFFTFYHAWHHFVSSGVGWRQVSDVAMTLHAYHGQLDLDKLRQWLTTMHLMQPWQAFGWLMVEHLGLPEAEMPFYNPSSRRTAQKLYRRIMAEGNFQRPNRYKHSKPRRAGLGRKLHTFLGIFVEFFQLVSLFPSQSFRKMRAAFKQAFSKNFQKNEFFFASCELIVYFCRVLECKTTTKINLINHK